jgi:dGTP triphosphohydrolase
VAAYEWFTSRDGDLEPFYRAQLVVDYIAGMTDSHVLKIFNMINGTQQFGIE